MCLGTRLQNWGWSEERSFITPPLPGCGLSPPSLTTPQSLAQIAAEAPTLAARRAALAATATHGKHHAAQLATKAVAQGSEAAQEDSLQPVETGQGLAGSSGTEPAVQAQDGDPNAQASGPSATGTHKHKHDLARSAMEQASTTSSMQAAGAGSSPAAAAQSGRQCGGAGGSLGQGAGGVVRVLLAADIAQSEDDGSDDVGQAAVASLNTTRRLAADADNDFTLFLTPGALRGVDFEFGVEGYSRAAALM